jgi:signal transduction histidine kinase
MRLWIGGCGVAVVIEALAYDGRPGLAAADLAVAIAFFSAARFARGRIALLFAATAGAWCLGTLAPELLLYAHRGPLVHLLLAYPSGRLTTPASGAVVAAAYLDGLVVPLAESDTVTAVLLSAVVVTAALGRQSDAAIAAAVVAVALLAPLSPDAELLLYEATLVAVAARLALPLRPKRRERVTDLVVDLGSAPFGPVREALARALGDPTLEVTFASGDSTLTLPESGADRAVTPVERDGRLVAVLVHDAVVSDDPALVEAVGQAARLAAANAGLQAELRSHVAELERSRRRVVEAGDAQRSRLERRLRQAADVHLREMRLALARARRGGALDEPLDLVERELDAAIAELHELARGIHPHVLAQAGLGAALDELASTAAVTVHVAAPAARFPAPVETAAFFVCAEALANVAKYAETPAADVHVRRADGRLIVRVSDRGRGGADPARGSGLSGLADRVHAIGGCLSVSSPPCEGTTVLAEIPLEAGT